MVEMKDVPSSPVRAPKSQLAIEWPLRGECWNLQKKIYPISKDKEATARW